MSGNENKERLLQEQWLKEVINSPILPLRLLDVLVALAKQQKGWAIVSPYFQSLR